MGVHSLLMSEAVTGVGGVFLKARDPAALARWYGEHLGLPVDPSWSGAVLRWRDDPSQGASTVWSLFAEDSTYFGAPSQRAMVNFRVRDLDAMLAQLRAAGATVDERVESSEFGRFGWFSDPEGNRVELWQPPDGR